MNAERYNDMPVKFLPEIGEEIVGAEPHPSVHSLPMASN